MPLTADQKKVNDMLDILEQVTESRMKGVKIREAQLVKIMSALGLELKNKADVKKAFQDRGFTIIQASAADYMKLVPSMTKVNKLETELERIRNYFASDPRAAADPNREAMKDVRTLYDFLKAYPFQP